MPTIPLRPLGFGEIVDGAVQLYRRDFGLYYLIALVGAVPGYVLTLASGADISSFTPDAGSDPVAMLREMGYSFTVMLIGAAISWVGMVAVAVAMAERIEERRASLGAAYRNALRHLPSAAGATIVASLIFVAIGTVVLIVGGIVSAPLVGSGSVGLALMGLALVLLAVTVTGIFWMAATFGILPAVVIEGRRAMSALRRSFSLCRGGWPRVIGIMVVALIINVAPSLAISSVFGFQDFFASPEALGTVSSERQWLLNTADLVIGPLTTPFMVGSIMVLFHDRRVRSEAYDLETLASAMDAP